MVTVSAVKDGVKYYTADDYYLQKHGNNIGIDIVYGKDNLKRMTGIDLDRINKEKLFNTLVKEGVGSERMVGKDLTFSAPKSVSILAGLTDNQELKKGIWNAHEKAVLAVADYIERNTFLTRKTENGVTESVKATGMVALGFNHFLSREKDPQIHTHFIVLNIAQREDGSIRAIDADKIFSLKNLHTYDAIYKMSLAQELEKIGLQLEYDKDGRNWEIAGISRESIEKFSQREQIIREYAQREGLDLNDSNDRKRAILNTRPQKEHVSIDELKKTWQERGSKINGLTEALKKQEENFTLAKEMLKKGASEKEVAEVLRNQTFQERKMTEGKIEAKWGTDRPTVDILAEAARQALSLQEGVFNKQDFMREVSAFLISQRAENDNYKFRNFSLKDVEKVFEQFTQNKEVMYLGTDNGQQLYATKEFIKAEHRIIEATTWEKDAFMSEKQYQQLSKEFWKSFEEKHGFALSDEQRNAVKMIYTSNKQILGIQGYAGVGKSAMFAAVKEFRDFVNGRIEEAQKYAKGIVEEKYGNLSFEEKKEKFTEIFNQKAEELGVKSLSKFDAFYGAAPTGQAAKVLGKDAGLDTMTVHKMLNNIERYGDFTKSPNTVAKNEIKDPEIDRHWWDISNTKMHSRGLLIIDEAGMMDTRLMANAVEVAKQTGVRLVLSGDVTQFQSVGSGIAFQLMQEKGMETSYITNIRRQKDESLREIATQIAKGNAVNAYEKLKNNGNVNVYDKEGATEESKMQNLLEDLKRNFYKDWQNSKNTYVIVGTNKIKDIVNNEIRQMLIEKKEIDTSKTLSVDIIKRDTTQKYLALGEKVKKGQQIIEKREFAVGDRIVFLKNDNILNRFKEKIREVTGKVTGNIQTFSKEERYERVAVKNGNIGFVKNVDPEKGTLTVELSNGKNITFNPKQYKYINHAFAITAHKSQGATIDHVHSILDGKDKTLNRNAFYVHLTRTKHTYRAYVLNEERIKEKITNWQMNKSAIKTLEYLEHKEHEKIKLSLSNQAESLEKARTTIDKKLLFVEEKLSDLSIKLEKIHSIKNEQKRENFIRSITNGERAKIKEKTEKMDQQKITKERENKSDKLKKAMNKMEENMERVKELKTNNETNQKEKNELGELEQKTGKLAELSQAMKENLSELRERDQLEATYTAEKEIEQSTSMARETESHAMEISR